MQIERRFMEIYYTKFENEDLFHIFNESLLK